MRALLFFPLACRIFPGWKSSVDTACFLRMRLGVFRPPSFVLSGFIRTYNLRIFPGRCFKRSAYKAFVMGPV